MREADAHARDDPASAADPAELPPASAQSQRRLLPEHHLTTPLPEAQYTSASPLSLCAHIATYHRRRILRPPSS